METKNNINENNKSVSNKTNIWALIFKGEIFLNTNIHKHLGYIIFVFFLAAIYIGYRYKVVNTAIESKKLDHEIKQLHAEHVRKSAELMEKGIKLEILKQIQKRNLTLKESKSPFILIKID